MLVPLFEDPGTGAAHVILTQRASGMRTHAGEVSFPGGKREAGDASDACTALREAQEELGMDPARVRVLGCLPPLLSKHLLSVTPVLGTIRARQAFHPNPDEVARVFACPLRMFLEAGPNHSFHDTTLAGSKPYRCAGQAAGARECPRHAPRPAPDPSRAGTASRRPRQAHAVVSPAS